MTGLFGYIIAGASIVAGMAGLAAGGAIDRSARRCVLGEPAVRVRSRCEACGHEETMRDLVPVFGWLTSKGKCRFCGHETSARRPVAEAVCGIVFMAIVAAYGVSLQAVELLVFSGILLYLSLTDLDDRIIPNGCIIAAIVVRMSYWALSRAFALTGLPLAVAGPAAGAAAAQAGAADLASVVYYVMSAFALGLVLLVLVLVADKAFGRDSMGGGDLKLYFVAGLYFGWEQGMLVILLSCVFAITVALLAPLAKSAVPAPEGDHAEPAPHAEGEGVLQRAIPFGPSIAAACVIVMLAGSPLALLVVTAHGLAS